MFLCSNIIEAWGWASEWISEFIWQPNNCTELPQVIHTLKKMRQYIHRTGFWNKYFQLRRSWSQINPRSAVCGRGKWLIPPAMRWDIIAVLRRILDPGWLEGVHCFQITALCRHQHPHPLSKLFLVAGGLRVWAVTKKQLLLIMSGSWLTVRDALILIQLGLSADTESHLTELSGTCYLFCISVLQSHVINGHIQWYRYIC